jgi:hypothetical protein
MTVAHRCGRCSAHPDPDQSSSGWLWTTDDAAPRGNTAMILAVVFTLAAAMANAINLMTQHKASIWRATTGEGLAAGAGLAAAAAVATSAWPPQSARSCSRRWPCTAARCRWCTAAGYRTGLRAGAAPDMDSPGRGPRRLGVGQRRLRDAGVFMAVGEPTGGHPFPAAKQWRLEQALAAVAEGIGNACGSHGQHREDDGAPGPPRASCVFSPHLGDAVAAGARSNRHKDMKPGQGPGHQRHRRAQ